MAETIGADTVSLRKIFKERGNVVEEAFIKALPPDVLELYQNTIATNWVPIDKYSILYDYASDALFPNNPDRVVKTAKILAKKSFSGVFKIFLLIPSVKYIISRAASIWRNYYNKGVGMIENEVTNGCDFVVTEFPELPKNLRLAVIGHVTVLVELAGKKNVKVEHIETNSKKWIWKIRWE